MIIHDPIYGDFDITEPVLLELLDDPAVQRIGKVMQGGPTPVVCGWPDFTRLEHCIGAMLLVRKLGASLDEQIAALLHDVPHTAFSHVIDIVFAKKGEQSYHEEIKDHIIRNSTIPEILKKHGFSLENILEDSNFKLLERPSPDLCADRVDYALRCHYYYLSNKGVSAQELASHLIVHNNEIVFDSLDAAVSFGSIFMDISRNIFSGELNMASYQILADAIRYALEKEFLQEADLLKSDREVWEFLEQSGDQYILGRLKLLSPNLTIEKVDAGNHHYVLYNKKRWVRPKALVGGLLKDSYTASEKLQNQYDEYTQWISKPLYVVVKGL